MPVTVKINIDSALRELRTLGDSAMRVTGQTIYDVRNRAQAPIRRATSNVYAIKQKEVISKTRTKTSPSAGRIRVRGKSLDSLVLVYTGAKHADWPTRTKSGKNKVKKVSGNAYSNAKQYKVTQETYRGKREFITAKQPDTRVFVADVGGKMRPMVAKTGERKPLVHASTSLPQAVMNPRTVEIWQPALHRLIMKRLTHNIARFGRKS